MFCSDCHTLNNIFVVNIKQAYSIQTHFVYAHIYTHTHSHFFVPSPSPIFFGLLIHLLCGCISTTIDVNDDFVNVCMRACVRAYVYNKRSLHNIFYEYIAIVYRSVGVHFCGNTMELTITTIYIYICVYVCMCV